jgi:hypothetical protein
MQTGHDRIGSKRHDKSLSQMFSCKKNSLLENCGRALDQTQKLLHSRMLNLEVQLPLLWDNRETICAAAV